MELTCTLTLVPPLPHSLTPPTQTGLRVRHLRSTHPQGFVCVGGYQSITMGGGGEGVGHIPSPLSPESTARRSAPPLTLTHVDSPAFVLMLFGLLTYCPLRHSVAFGLMSFGLISPSALCRSRPNVVRLNFAFRLMSFWSMSFGLMTFGYQ